MGFFDSVIEQTIDLSEKRRGIVLLPDFKGPSRLLSSVAPFQSDGDGQPGRRPRWRAPLWGFCLGSPVPSGDFYGKSAEVTLDITVWSPLSAGGEAAWETASSLCGDLMFSGLGFTSVQCGEISYHSGAMALTLPCQAKIRLAFGKASGGEAVSGVVVKGKLAQGKEVE